MNYKKLYQGKRCLVIGGAGFLGRHLVQALHEAGAIVACLDRTKRNYYEAPAQDVRYYTMGVMQATDYALCDDWAGVPFNGRCDYVFNLAAQVAGIQHNMKAHKAMYQANMEITLEVHRLLEHMTLSRFLQVSSVCVYPWDVLNNNGFQGNDLDSAMRMMPPSLANEGYAMAKRQAELLAAWDGFGRVGGGNYESVIVRPTNLYGEFDYFPNSRADLPMCHVIPALIYKSLTEEKIKVMGDGTSKRDFLHARDAALGLMAVMALGEDKGIYNMGTGKQYSINELLGIVRATIGGGTLEKEVIHIGGGQGESSRPLSLGRIVGLGWKPEIPLERGLAKTVTWYAKQAPSDIKKAFGDAIPF